MKNCIIQQTIYIFLLLVIALFVVALIFALMGLNAYAQGQSEETRFLQENGFLTRWLALGPFIEGEPAPTAIWDNGWWGCQV